MSGIRATVKRSSHDHLEKRQAQDEEEEEDYEVASVSLIGSPPLPGYCDACGKVGPGAWRRGTGSVWL